MRDNIITIGVDLDGTLADHTKAKLWLAEKLGFTLKPRETASEVLERIMPKKEYRILQRRLYTEMTHLADPFEYAAEALSRLAQRGHAISLVSRRGAGNTKEAEEWLKLNLFLPCFTGGIFFVRSDEEKDGVCRREHISIFIDDQLKVLSLLSTVSIRILFDPFNNFSSKLHEGIKTSPSWLKIYEFLCLCPPSQKTMA